MTISVNVAVALAEATAQDPESVRGVLNVMTYGAKGNGTDDDTQAFQAAIADLGTSGGIVIVPQGTFKITSDLVIDRAMTLMGLGKRVTFLAFSQGKAIKIRGTEGGNGGGRSVTLCGFRYLGNAATFAEWAPSTPYSTGAAVRSRLLVPYTLGQVPPEELDSESFTGQHDAGLHFRVVSGSGTSGLTEPPWSSLPGDLIADGDLTWIVEDWSAITVESSQVLISDVSISGATDSGIFVHGTIRIPDDPAISDGTAIVRCDVDHCNGHGLYFVGSDAQLNRTDHCFFEVLPRGVGIWDAGQHTSRHEGNQAVLCRGSFIASGTFAATAWLANYHEACGVGHRLASSHIWLNGTGGPSAHNAGKGFNGDALLGEWKWEDDSDPPWSRTFGGTVQETIHRDGDIFPTADEWLTTVDKGGRLSLRFSSNDLFTAREITGARSILGPCRWRFPSGFYLGDIWHTAAAAPPGATDYGRGGSARLWAAGDMVENTGVGGSAPWGWRAARAGGWGGGRYHSSRTYTPTAALGIGEGVEASSGNSKVFRAVRFETRISGVWTEVSELYRTLPAEPTWVATDGQETTAVQDADHRIVFVCWGDSGMTWDVGPLRSGSTTTT